MSNPLPPKSEPNPEGTSSKTREHNYAEYIEKNLKDLIRLEPKYDKSIFEIKQEQEKEYSERESVDPVAEVEEPDIPRSPTAGPADIFGRPPPLEIPEAVAAAEKAKAAQQASLEEYEEEQYQNTLAQIIRSMEELALEAEKIDASDIQKQIELINRLPIENLPGLGYNEDTIVFLRQKYMELKEQYEAERKKMEESAKKAKSAQEELEEERENAIIKNLERVHNGLANAVASAGIDELERYDIGVLWGEGNTEVIVNAYQQRIDEFRKEIEKQKERMIQEKKDKAIKDLKEIEENFEKLKREVEELDVVKKNGEKIQEAIEKNYDNLLETRKKIEDINVQSKLDVLMEKSDEMEIAIRERVEQIEEKEYSIDGEEKLQEEIKKCNNEYFLNLRNATVNHIKLTIEKLKGKGIKNIKNEDIKARIYGQIKKGGNKSTDLNFYLFLSIVDFLLFMINPPEYKKKDKKLNYKNLKTSFYKDINEIINKEAEKLENVEMLFGFIKRRRDLRDIDENWLCENINS